MQIDMNRLKETFFAEAADHLVAMEADILRLDAGDPSGQPLQNIFRCAHSIKGGAAAFQFEDLTRFTHGLETLLDEMRNGLVPITPAIMELLLQSNDMLGNLIGAAKKQLGPIAQAVDLLKQLNQCCTHKPVPMQPTGAQTVVGSTFQNAPTLLPKNRTDPSDPSQYKAKFFGAHLVNRGLVTVDQILKALDEQSESQTLFGQLALSEGKMTPDQVLDALNWACDRDVQFGDAAIALGHLTETDSASLLALQRRSRRSLGDILVASGALSAQELEQELAIYRNERSGIRATPESLESEIQSAKFTMCSMVNILENKEMLRDFVLEANEHLEAAEQHLLALESDPTCRESLDAIYRAFHTIKGTSSFFNLQDITSLAHVAEDLFNEARDGRVVLAGNAFDLALASVDGLKRLVGLVRDCLVTNAAEMPCNNQEAPLLAALRQLIKGQSVSTELPSSAAAPRPAPPQDSINAASPHVAAQDQAGNERGSEWSEKETVKVDRDRLDNLINVIGELVIGESMVGLEIADWQTITGRESLALPQMKKIVRDLQEMSLSLRMVPVGATFQKMARIVRDVAKRLGKQIQFHTQGEDTEIDKTVVDQIGDPLMHMVRNAADHGIEAPDHRIAAGKTPQGHVTLRAFHQGGHIIIELEDDGKGLDHDAIKRKAIERGLIGEGVELSEAETCDLIFKPGFSTAKVITDISGRGVGMDVVRRNVEALQGSVTVRSTFGQGSIVTIRLPLTLAILDGLTVSLADQKYILPLISVVESFRPRPSEVKRVAGHGEVVLVRGEVVPLLRLHRLFNLVGKVNNPCEGLVVIVEDQRRKFAVLVDELLGQSQVVIKNLETNFRKVEGVAGATILGDGQIALILDVQGLSRLTNKVLPPADGAAVPSENRLLLTA